VREYRDAGIDYDVLDAVKRSAVEAAAGTSHLLDPAMGRADDRSRGEPAFVFTVGDRTMALVIEGLGTKSLIATAYEREGGPARLDAVAYDAVAAVVNDLLCVGALPLVVSSYFAVGSSPWYEEGSRADDLIRGWRRGCQDAGAAWGGGESPTLPGLVAEEGIELAGCAVGAVPEGVQPFLGDELAPGDAVVLVASSGLHANGATLARRLAAGLPDGYRTTLPSGRELGEALLEPSIMYVSLVRALLAERLPVTYLSHITGHGLRKVMRARRDLGYRLTSLPEVPEVLSFLADGTGMSPHSAYGTLNMGAGFAVFCRSDAVAEVIAAAEREGLRAIEAGRVEPGPRRVVLEPVGVVFEGSELSLR
jgi:phosphoribosylformylglycinamidine cyclo-ligase